ncbi:hypothetical protein CMUS01_10854 [Colletotrichum musicola]|uniref:Uncharacterized protein n=1 Tax=Colletotrichum musicola TaxID=2175873 RepID=A0A8H6K244_9PEZI|nr:hypothetical protein CMUS01_10854 [Colletotrichum musicola]
MEHEEDLMVRLKGSSNRLPIMDLDNRGQEAGEGGMVILEATSPSRSPDQPHAALSPSAPLQREDIGQCLGNILSQSKNEEVVQRALWDDFDARRLSACRHLRQYLDHLREAQAGRPRRAWDVEHSEDDQTASMDVYPREPDVEMTDDQERLCLDIEDDLVAMYRILDLLKPEPDFRLTGNVFPAAVAVVVLSLLGRSFRKGALAVAAASVAGFMGCNWSHFWKSFEAASIQACADKIEGLLQRLPLDRVDERDLETLEGSFGPADSLMRE